MLAGIPTLVWDKSLIVRECPELLRRTHNYKFAERPIRRDCPHPASAIE